jgi:hypothetical protein
MRENGSEKYAQAPWRVPVAVEEVAESGEHFDLIADVDVRSEVARLAGVRDLPRLEASFDVTRHGAAGLRVVGRVSATVGQICVVTLEPLTNDVEEGLDLVFVPQPAPPEPRAGETKPKDEPREVKWNAPEPLIDGRVDLGVLATEFVILGLDPYPRKPEAAFQPPLEVEPPEGPFAGLGGLKKGRDGG